MSAAIEFLSKPFDVTYRITDSDYRIIIYQDTISAPFHNWSDSNYGLHALDKSWLYNRMQQPAYKPRGPINCLVMAVIQAQKDRVAEYNRLRTESCPTVDEEIENRHQKKITDFTAAMEAKGYTVTTREGPDMLGVDRLVGHPRNRMRVTQLKLNIAAGKEEEP